MAFGVELADMAIVVKKKKGESKDDLIGRFRRFALQEEIKEEIQKRMAYINPSQKRREKKKAMARRLYAQKKQQKESQR